MGVTTSTTAANISYKDSLGRIFKWVSSRGEFVDHTFYKQDNAISYGIFDASSFGWNGGRYKAPLLSTEEVMESIAWDYPFKYNNPSNDTYAYFDLEKAYLDNGDAKWEYSSPTSATPTGLMYEYDADLTVHFVWNTTLKCFVDTRLTATSKTIKSEYASSSPGIWNDENVQNFPYGTMFVTTETISGDPTDTYYVQLPLGYTWANTTAGNYNFKYKGVTWTYVAPSGDNELYWYTTGGKIALLSEDWRYGGDDVDVIDKISTATFTLYGDSYSGNTANWPASITFNPSGFHDAVYNGAMVEKASAGTYVVNYKTSDGDTFSRQNASFSDLAMPTVDNYYEPYVYLYTIPINW
jgi:hypothetical protein